MDTFNSISRRESLLGIGAAGTLLGGGALGVSSVMAGEESNGKTDDGDDGDTVTSKKGRFELALVCYEKGTAEFRVSNETDAAAKLNWTVDSDVPVDGGDADTDDGDVDEDFDPDGETIEDGEEVDDDGDDDDDDDNGDVENGGGDGDYALEGKLTVPKGGSETFRADVVSKDATVALYHDGKKVAATDVEKLDCESYSPAEKIDLEAVCYRTRKDDDYYDGTTGDDGDTDGSEADDAPEDFDPDGETIEDGEEVDDDGDDDDDDDDNGDVEDGDAENGDADADKRTVREVKFRVTNDGKQKVKTNWTVQGDGQGGKCYVDAKDDETFWVTALENQKTYVSLTYEDEEVATVKADATTECDGDC